MLGRGLKICLALRGEMSADALMPWNEKENSRGEGEAAADENRTAERKKGRFLRKIHHRGSQDKTEV